MGVRAVTVGPEVGFNDLGKGIFYNNSGSDITAGMVCYVSGGKISSGNTDTDQPLRTIAAADADADGGAMGRLVIAAQDIANGKDGWCVDWMWHRMDTSAMSAGDELWLSTTPGGVTNVKPATGKARKVGRVVQSGTTGLVYLSAVGLPEEASEGAGALAVGESRVFSATVNHDDSPEDTVLFSVPDGQTWTTEFTIVDLTETFDGTGADIDVGTSGTGNLLFDGNVDLTNIATTVETVTIQELQVIEASGSAEDVTIDVTPGTTPTQGSARVFVRATRLS